MQVILHLASKTDLFAWLEEAEGFIQYYLDNKDRIESKTGNNTTALAILDTIVHDLTGIIYEDECLLPKCTGYGKYKQTKSTGNGALTR